MKYKFKKKMDFSTENYILWHILLESFLAVLKTLICLGTLTDIKFPFSVYTYIPLTNSVSRQLYLLYNKWKFFMCRL